MRKFTFILLITHSSLLIGQTPTQEWAARYQRPSGSSGIANQMALDKVGNCYVLGNSIASGGVMVLIKYNSIGDTVWTRTYPAGNIGVVSDSIGNVYVTGYVGPTFGPYNVITIKYNPQGVQLWVKIYDSGFTDEPRDIIMDGQGNVYIGGFSGNGSLIIKYNPNGDTVWTRKYSQTGFRYAFRSITIDNQNNVCAGGGRETLPNGAIEYFTIKYDNNGTFQWIQVTTFNSIAIYTKVKTDATRNVIVTGDVLSKIVTIKYDAAGNQQWQRLYDGPGSGDKPYDMEIDRQGNILITGASNGIGTGSYDYVTIKYNNINGDSLWVKRYNGSYNANDEAYSLDLDDSDNVYITGRSININTSWDYVTIKYNSNGSQQWLAAYNYQPANSDDVAYVIKVDKNRNVYVTGISDRGGTLFDYATVKYSQPVGIVNISNDIPNKFNLKQNYPNPFNPTTNIEYQITKTGHVKLLVSDVLGKEINILVNEIQKRGTYKVNFNSNSIASGVYFYKLITENYTETRKMMLIK